MAAAAARIRTKSQLVADLLLREGGCTQAEVLSAIGWPSINIHWHAKNNGLQLRIEKINGHNRYFGKRRQIQVRKTVRPWQPRAEPVVPPSPLAALCAEHDFLIIERKGRVLTCKHCYLGFRIYQKDDSANPHLRKHLEHHAEIHRRREAKKVKS
jgi:hypothetical protein